MLGDAVGGCCSEVRSLLLVASATFSMPSFSADFQKGLDAYIAETIKGFSRLRPLAEQVMLEHKTILVGCTKMLVLLRATQRQ